MMEVVVATAIFAGTVTLMLNLFNYTLQINRRVQAMRQVAQGTRNFTETIAREIRNGRIDYDVDNMDSNCDPANYSSPNNTSLGLLSYSGEHVCFYLDANSQQLYISKITNNTDARETINPINFKINPATFHFYIRPVTDPNPSSAPYPGIQPFVTMVAEFRVQLSGRDPVLDIPYQTTISTDVYDINHYDN